MVPKNAQKPPNFKRLLVPKRTHLHWAQDQGDTAGLSRLLMISRYSRYNVAHRLFRSALKLKQQLFWTSVECSYVKAFENLFGSVRIFSIELFVLEWICSVV